VHSVGHLQQLRRAEDHQFVDLRRRSSGAVDPDGVLLLANRPRVKN